MPTDEEIFNYMMPDEVEDIDENLDEDDGDYAYDYWKDEVRDDTQK